VPIATEMEHDAGDVLAFLVDEGVVAEDGDEAEGATLTDALDLDPRRVNDAVALLEQSGLATTYRAMGAAPYDFLGVGATSLGRFQRQKMAAEQENAEGAAHNEGRVARLPVPIGSPFGFTELDWEFVTAERHRTDELKVVMGYQFESEWYDWDRLHKNLGVNFAYAVAQYSAAPGNDRISTNMKLLGAGYGEHLFNEIARDIISADIAVFETSDLNPNVMIEMGVALTWGTRVMPLRAEGRPRPPSDVSGQTWVEYRDSGDTFIDPAHTQKLLAMVERVMRRKSATT
jgi:hypothetical protein